jgi:hypothetical protein
MLMEHNNEKWKRTRRIMVQIRKSEEFYQLVRDLLQKLEMSQTERIHLFKSYHVAIWTYEPQTWAYITPGIRRLMVIE